MKLICILFFAVFSSGFAMAQSKPCSKLFSDFKQSYGERKPAAAQDSKTIILTYINQEKDADRLKLLSKSLLDMVLSDGDRDTKLAFVASWMGKGMDLKRLLSDCTGGEATLFEDKPKK